MKEKLYKRLLSVLFIALILFSLIHGLQVGHSDKRPSELKDYYQEHLGSTGSRNLVEAILLDYRAYDTFGEVMVLYIAISGVIILGRKVRSLGRQGDDEEEKNRGETD